MTCFVDDEGHICAPVKWHTRQKHYFLEEYLKIWSENVGKSKKSCPSLDIFDLFASYGWCYCKDNGKMDLPGSTWPRSSVLAAKCLENYPNGRLLFSNTYAKPKELAKQEESLKKNLSSFKIKKIITKLPVTEAVDVAIKRANPNFPSLWILDPYGHSALPWEVIEKICKLKGTYTDKNGINRRPELLITLMTYGLQINIKPNPETISLALGMNETEWRPKLEKYNQETGNYREAIIRIYEEKLAEYYVRKPITVRIKGTQGNIVYALFLLTNSDAGHYVMEIHNMPEYKKWFDCEWKKNAEKITARKKLPSDQTSIFDFKSNNSQ